MYGVCRVICLVARHCARYRSATKGEYFGWEAWKNLLSVPWIQNNEMSALAECSLIRAQIDVAWNGRVDAGLKWLVDDFVHHWIVAPSQRSQLQMTATWIAAFCTKKALLSYLRSSSHIYVQPTPYGITATLNAPAAFIARVCHLSVCSSPPFSTLIHQVGNAVCTRKHFIELVPSACAAS
jgi:hypothetical protein